MSLLTRVAKSSLIYTLTRLLQKAIGLLLLPVYTRYLTPDDYGIISVVGSLTGLFFLLAGFCLSNAVSRFDFDYRHEPEKLRRFWGSIIALVMLISASLTALLLVLGPSLLSPVSGSIPFWPFLALGLLTVLFQPVVEIYVTILQTVEKARRCAVFMVANFLLNLLLNIALVVFLRWQAQGVLIGGLLTAVVFFALSFYALRGEIKLNLDRSFLKQSLKYCLPLVPHSLSSQITLVADRLLLNQMISTASAGIYSIGFLFGNGVSLLTTNANRAYFPVAMDALKQGTAEQLARLKETGMLLIITYCLAASAMSLFGRELVTIFTTLPFHGAHLVIPIISFSFVLEGLYYLFVSILFYDSSTTKLVPVGTAAAAIGNITLNLCLIPRLGMYGAALAVLFSQMIQVLVIGLLGRRHEKIRWDYGRMVCLFVLAAAPSLAVNTLECSHAWLLLSAKCLLLLALPFLLSWIAFGQPLFLLVRLRGYLRHRWGSGPCATG